jgi:hypothetical protein
MTFVEISSYQLDTISNLLWTQTGFFSSSVWNEPELDLAS